MSLSWLALPIMILLAGCKPPPDAHGVMAAGDPAAGRAVVVRVGCAACHRFPDLSWPHGALGPDLSGFGRQGLIAGRLPNRPDALAAFVRNAPALVAGSTMPAMPISEQESRDVAAYLYTLDGR